MRIGLIVLAAAAALAAGPAWADCAPLTIETTVALADNANGLAVVPATLGSEQRAMAIDTGTAVSELSQQAVGELHLPITTNQFAINGPKEKWAGVSPFALGGISTRTLSFRIALDGRGADGAIAADLLHLYDVDFDFGGDKLNLISPNHCDGKVVYWPATGVAVVAAGVQPDGRIVVPVTVNGHMVKALLSTGSATSSVTDKAARAELGMTEAFAGDVKTIDSLGLEGISLTNTKIAVVSRLTDASNRTVDPALGVGMILGMDMLRHFHLYVAYKEQKLYVTPK